jgi:hypothetical protein
MPSNELLRQNFPFGGSSGANFTIDPATKAANITGATTVISQAFEMERFSSFSLAYQGTGTLSGTPTIWACNDYDPNRPTQFPGTWQNVTLELVGNTAPQITFKPMSNVGAPFAGAPLNGYFVCWTCPFAAIRFQWIIASGAGLLTAQFIAKNV